MYIDHYRQVKIQDPCKSKSLEMHIEICTY